MKSHNIRHIVKELVNTGYMLMVFMTLLLAVSQKVNASEFCGEPQINSETSAGLYIWKDCERRNSAKKEHWFITIAAGSSNEHQLHTGSIQSQMKLNLIDTDSLETDDIVLVDNGVMPRLISFQSTVMDNDTDTFSFFLQKNSNLALLTIDENVSLKIYAGQSKIRVLSPLDLRQEPLAAVPVLTVGDVVASEEDQQVEFTVSLNQPPGSGNTVSLNLSTQDGTAVSNSDYKTVNMNIKFTDDQVIQKVIVELMDDCLAEPLESFNLIVSDVEGASITNTVQSATIVDTDVSYSNAELGEYGYISIAEFNEGQPDGQKARPNDNIDDTQAIQAAIDKAITEGKSVFFPQGEWQVSNTLKGMMTLTEVAPGKWKQINRNHVTSLIGSVCGNKRPKIVLQPTDDSFDDPATNYTRKPVVWIYSQNRDGVTNSFHSPTTKGSVDPEHHQAGISFNQIVRGIDFDLSSANTSGAIAIRHPGSQGSSISDVNVDLGSGQNGAYSAFDNPPGQGGGLYNVKVTGGNYAVTTNRDVRYPVIVGAEFIDQSVAAIDLSAHSSLVMTGFHIKSRFLINGIQMSNFCSGCGFANNVNLIDGVIDLDHSQSIAIKNSGDKGIYLDNVYFRGASAYELFLGANTPDYWYQGETLHAEDFIYLGKKSAISDNGLFSPDSAGQQRGTITLADTSPPLNDLFAIHIWDSDFPSFEDDDVVNAKTATDMHGNLYSLGTADDTVALQNLINDHQKIFLPSGTYTVSDSLILRKDTVLLGAEKHSTRIRAVGDWPLGAPIIKIDPYLVEADARDATTIVAGLNLISSGGGADAMRKNSFLHWTAGRNSIVRDISVGTEAYHGTAASDEQISNTPAFYIHATGGGRWYGVFGEWTNLKFNTGEPGYRALKVENTLMYSEPLQIYGLNIERNRSNPQMEVNHAANVSIYSFKVESHYGPLAEDKANDPLHISNAENIKVIGLTGGAKPEDNVIKIRNSTDIELINISSVLPQSDYMAIDTGLHDSIPGTINAYLLGTVP